MGNSTLSGCQMATSRPATTRISVSRFLAKAGIQESTDDDSTARRSATPRGDSAVIVYVDDGTFVDPPNSDSSRWGGGVTADEMREMQWVRPELPVRETQSARRSCRQRSFGAGPMSVSERPEADVVSAASDSLKGGRSKRWPQDVYVLALLVAHKTPYLHSPGSLVDEDAHIVSARHGVCCDVP